MRSPYPHAEIKNIDIAEAMKVPGVKAVITGKDLDRVSEPVFSRLN